MRVKLKEICIPKQWKTISTNELRDSGYPVYGANGIIGYYNEYNHEVDTLLVTCRGATCGSLNISKGKAYVNGNAMALDNLRNDIDIKYLYYYLKCRGFKDVISGSAQPQIIRSAIEEIDVEIKDKEEQESIVSKCERIERLVDKIKKLQNYLDTLIKARFVEMFGDIESNDKNFKIVKFEDCIEYMGDIGSNGANKVVVDHLDMKDEEDYALLVRFLNFTNNDFKNNVKYISKEAYNFFKKSQIFGGELIFCKIGSAGLNYIMPYLNRPVSLGLNQIMIRTKDNINILYLYNYLNLPNGTKLIKNCINGAVTKSITKTEIKKIPIFLPPIDLQNQFAVFVKEVDKLKFDVQKSLEKTQMLFDSLMQEYFG